MYAESLALSFLLIRLYDINPPIVKAVKWSFITQSAFVICQVKDSPIEKYLSIYLEMKMRVFIETK
jgi:hypothetical protein